MKGSLEVICGPMYSGKSEELLRRLRRVEISRQSFFVYKPDIDTRYASDKVVSHSGFEKEARRINNPYQIIADMSNLPFYVDVIAIDEAQFFDVGIIEVVKQLVDDGVRVIVAGLDQTYREEPFGYMPELLALADHVDKLKALCHLCWKEATTTQRLVDGKPASYKGDTVLVGAVESYEARCRDHHEAA